MLNVVSCELCYMSECYIYISEQDSVYKSITTSVFLCCFPPYCLGMGSHWVRRWSFWLDWPANGLLGPSCLRHLMLELQAYKAMFCLFKKTWMLLIWTQLLTPEKHIHIKWPLPLYSSGYRIQDAPALKIHPITKGLAGSCRIPLRSARLQSCTQQGGVLWVHSYPLWWAQTEINHGI